MYHKIISPPRLQPRCHDDISSGRQSSRRCARILVKRTPCTPNDAERERKDKCGDSRYKDATMRESPASQHKMSTLKKQILAMMHDVYRDIARERCYLAYISSIALPRARLNVFSSRFGSGITTRERQRGSICHFHRAPVTQIPLVIADRKIIHYHIAANEAT